MSEVRTFFRFCPACGRRFHIRVTGKKLVEEREEKSTVREGLPTPVGYGGIGMVNPVMLEQDIPITVDVEEFQYTYKCKHCGHTWTELHTEERSAGGASPTGW